MRQRLLKLLCSIVLSCGLASPAMAQTIDSYEARWYNPGAVSPISTYAFDASNVSCGQPAPAPDASSTINPSTGATIVWDDPDSSGSVCTHAADPSSTLFALPIPGDYEAALIAINAVGQSGESNRAPFDMLNPPDAQTGTRVVR